MLATARIGVGSGCQPDEATLQRFSRVVTARFDINSRLTEVRRAVDLTEKFCARNALTARDSNAIAVALDEVLSNVIRHGFGDRAGHSISIALEYSNDEVCVEVEDGSAPFDPTQVPMPDLAPSIARRSIGGLGLVFVRALIDDVTYRRTSDRNCLKLRRRVSSGRQSTAPQRQLRVVESALGAGNLVSVEGPLDSENAKVFRDWLLERVHSGAAQLAIDLDRVSYIGSAGIWVLLAADRIATSKGGRLVLCGLSPEIARLFERVGIMAAFRVVEDSKDALAMLGSNAPH